MDIVPQETDWPVWTVWREITETVMGPDRWHLAPRSIRTSAVSLQCTKANTTTLRRRHPFFPYISFQAQCLFPNTEAFPSHWERCCEKNLRVHLPAMSYLVQQEIWKNNVTAYTAGMQMKVSNRISNTYLTFYFQLEFISHWKGT